MTAQPAVPIAPVEGSRLRALCAQYDDAKATADAATDRLKTITDGIKTEANALHPDARSLYIDAPGLLMQPLAVAYRESWRLDTTALKAQHPDVYARLARRSGSWRIERVKP